MEEEEAPVTAATGALGPVIAKLAALLGSEYKLRRRTRRDVKFIRSKLKPVHSILWNIWEKEELDEASKALKMQALDLADDVDDAIVDFVISMERSLSTKRLVQTKVKESPFQDFKKRATDVSGRCRRKWKKPFSCLLSCGKLPADDSSRPGKPRAYPFVRKDASELVGMAGPRDELIKHLIGEDDGTVELQLKTAFIYGLAGMGKTTLADLVYEAIGNKFQSRAFVSLTPGGNMREVLATILQQVAAVPLADTEASTEEYLIDIVSNFLKGKRYLVIIDDIWNWREWEVIMKSLPENNLGSRIVGTTRMKVVSDKCKDSFEPHALLYEMLPEWDRRTERWVYKIGGENIVRGMVAMKPDLVAERFSDEHPIVSMCGSTPLAVRCMLSAVAKEREKHGQHAKTRDVQTKIEKHVMEKGIQNTPGFEALVESLQLGYDDLPHHMLKTCLLYCSIYPDGQSFDKDTEARRWISEGFVYTEEEAHGYFEELVNRRLILFLPASGLLRMHPMMRNFLRWKSRQDNFTTCSSEITPSYDTCSIRRLCIDNSPYDTCTDAVDTLSALDLDWYRIRSLVAVHKGIERVPLEKLRIPFEKLDGLRALHICDGTCLLDHHWKDISGLVRMRHLLGLEISKIPPEIARLQCLETFVATGQRLARLPGFIGDLQQLRTLVVTRAKIKELPREIGALQQLQTLRIMQTGMEELPREIGELQQLRTLDISHTRITVLPKEIGEMQQLRTLDISYTEITVLPKEIEELRQLRTLDISYTEITVLPKEIGELRQLRTLDISRTMITVLPKEIGKLQKLEHLLMTGTRVNKIPREIGALKELKLLRLDYSIAALPLEVCTLVELPECIHQALNKSGLVSELAVEMLSFQKSRATSSKGIVVGAIQMLIQPWIREHFNDLVLLDIRICKLEEGGLKILREMPKLEELTLRFEVVPREPVVIGSEGFAMLQYLTVDSRVPRVTFKEGAMPKLEKLIFEFQFYAGPPNKDPVGVNHLSSLWFILFKCNKDWYGGGYSPCIRPTINIVRKEAHELPHLVTVKVCGREEEVCSSPSSWSEEEEEEEEEERSSGEGEIEEDIQA